MEQYSANGRFILTANYESRIIDAIRSRCQVLRFESLDRREVFKRARMILREEGVEHDTEDVLRVVDDHYPDVRGVVNALQLGSVDARFSYKGVSDTVGRIRDLIRSKDLNAVRSYVMTARPDFTTVYRGLFDTVERLAPGSESKTAIKIADYMYRDAIVADREVNFAACCLSIMGDLG
jgi:DNA polymerase III delta prime subunit